MDKLTREQEKEIILKCKKGDSSAMSKIYEIFKEELTKSTFRYIKNSDAVEDVVSETFINFFKAIDKFNTNYPIRPWLHKILKNEVNSYFKKQGNIISLSNDFFNMEFSEPNSDEEVFNSEEMNYVKKALSLIKKEEREILNFFYFNNLSVKEISIVLSIPEGTVKSRLFNARNSLSLKISELMKNRKNG